MAIVIDTRTPEAWVVDLLERVAAHPNLRLHLAIAEPVTGHESGTRPATPGSAGDRLARRLLRSSLLDRPRYASIARRATPLPDGCRGVAPEALEAKDVDVLLDVGVREPALERRLAPGTPLWSARTEHLEAHVERTLLARAPLLPLHLWRRDATRDEAPWTRLASHALPRQSFSITDLAGAAFRALPAVLVSRLGWLSAGHDPLAIETASLFGPSDEAEGVATRNGGELGPRAPRDALVLLARRNVTRLRNRFGGEQWGLAVTGGPGENGTTPPGPLERVARLTLEDWRPLEPPPDRIWADPHLCRHAGETHVFFEELPHGSSNAHISAVRLDEHGAFAGTPRPVLEEPFHLSYPFVFEHGGEHWMLPETAARGTVSLYRATRFPDRWEHATDLLVDVDLADSTLHRHADRWWLFTNRFSHRVVGERDELLIFFADTLEGPWTPHALNPVITGVDRARMAGPVLEEGGHHYRPSQYGAVRYGHGINLARIDELTPDVYRETPVHRLLPSPGSSWLGCHSLSSAGGLSVIDRVDRRRRVRTRS